MSEWDWSADVCSAVLVANLLVDCPKYDNDGDRILDFVYVIYAGYGEAQSNDESDIWPHFWAISNFNLKLDNTKINLYACSGELRGYKGVKLDGIGTICHESSHILGLPDMYDTSYETNNFGMGNWDIMDSGCYLNDGNTPCSYSAYERYFLGWLDPIVLDSPDQIELEALNISNKACILKSENSENEYFMIENRQRTGWDQYLPASGMLITRVNYNEKDWANNCVNNTEGKQGITIIPADNELLSYTNDEFSSSYTEYYLSMMGRSEERRVGKEC